jgi:tetratricopeptide (TPR) repeat protein
LFRKLKRWDEANKDFESAIRMNPDNGELYYLRSFCDTQKKNKALALQDVEKALSLGYKFVDTGYYNELRK